MSDTSAAWNEETLVAWALVEAGCSREQIEAGGGVIAAALESRGQLRPSVRDVLETFCVAASMFPRCRRGHGGP